MKFVRPLALAMMIAAALTLSACGGLSKTEYQSKVNKIMNKVDKEMGSFSNPDGAQMKKAAKLLDTAADDLDDITPPSEVKDLHADLIAEVRELSKLMKKLAPFMEMAQKDPAKAAGMQKDMADTYTKLQKVGTDLEKTRSAFIKKGYKNFKEKKK